MLLKLMDLKLLKNGYMKKFFKKVGSIIAIPLKVLLIMYSIPVFLLDYTIDVLDSKMKEATKYYKDYWKVLKFSWNNIIAGNHIVTRNMFCVNNSKEAVWVSKTNYI